MKGGLIGGGYHGSFKISFFLSNLIRVLAIWQAVT